MRWVLELLAVLFGAYLLISGLMLAFQERLVFPAPKYPLPAPESVGLTEAESIVVTAADGVKLRGWYLHPVPPPPESQRAPGLIWFYGNILEGTWTNFAVSAWLVVTAYWLLVQVFWFPMILELESEKVPLALRNALGMVIITPVFSLTLAVILVVVVVLSIVLTVPALLIMASLFLLIANHATRSRLAYAQRKPYGPEAEGD